MVWIVAVVGWLVAAAGAALLTARGFKLVSRNDDLANTKNLTADLWTGDDDELLRQQSRT